VIDESIDRAYTAPMTCPRCDRSDTQLEELDRDGVTIDRCTSCRGIWLDRGELEKLLARDSGGKRRRDDDDDDRRRRRDDDDDDDDRGGAGGWLSRFFD
jgi:Zn-finger nucleic acid-binding protein